MHCGSIAKHMFNAFVTNHRIQSHSVSPKRGKMKFLASLVTHPAASPIASIQSPGGGENTIHSCSSQSLRQQISCVAIVRISKAQTARLVDQRGSAIAPPAKRARQLFCVRLGRCSLRFWLVHHNFIHRNHEYSLTCALSSASLQPHSRWELTARARPRRKVQSVPHSSDPEACVERGMGLRIQNLGS